MLLLLLRRATKIEIATVSAEGAARELESRLASVYLIGRRNSKAVARAETVEELSDIVRRQRLHPPQLRQPTDRGQYRTPARPYDEEDLWKARRAARGYATNWADDAVEMGKEAATKAQEWRLELGAATESSDAFATERERVIQEFAEAYPEANLFKVWDATLDDRMCRFCGAMHGTIVRIDEDFPGGIPGKVHPKCYCTEQILTYDEVDLDYLAA
jgi:hypothetical protein